MRRATIVLAPLLLIAAACGGSDEPLAATSPPAATATTGPPTTTEPPATAPPETAPPETAPQAGTLVIAEIDFAGDRIVLRNPGDAPYDLAGHWLCNRPAYAPLPAEVLAPGATIEIAASSVGLSPGGGELGVYTDSDFGNPDAMVRYVAWGAPGRGRQDTAAAAGLWGADDFVANDRAAMVSTGDDPVGSADWSTTP